MLGAPHPCSIRQRPGWFSPSALRRAEQMLSVERSPPFQSLQLRQNFTTRRKILFRKGVLCSGSWAPGVPRPPHRPRAKSTPHRLLFNISRAELHSPPTSPIVSDGTSVGKPWNSTAFPPRKNPSRRCKKMVCLGNKSVSPESIQQQKACC